MTVLSVSRYTRKRSLLERCFQKAVFGYKWGGGGWPLKWCDTLGIYLSAEYVLWCIERQATFYGLLCRRSQATTCKNKKAHDVATSSLPHPKPLKRRISILVSADGSSQSFGGLAAQMRLVWSEGWRPPGSLSLHSSDEPSELSQWLCHDDSNINIVVVIIIIIIFFWPTGTSFPGA